MARSIGPSDPVTLGRWALTARLGQGSTAIVYRAVSDTGEIAAIKTMPPAVSPTGPVPLIRPSSRAALRREGTVLSALAGVDGVNHLLEIELGQLPFLALTYVDGPSLAELLARRDRLDTASAVSLAVQLAIVLAAVHRAGVVHGDVKPGNVILGPAGAVVVDFGAAAGLDAEATWAGHSLISPAFLAPELLEGRAPSTATDVFGWATTVAVCASGRTPAGSLAGRTPLALPPRVELLVRAAASSRPGERPTMDELASALIRPQRRIELPELTRSAPAPPGQMTGQLRGR